MKHAKNETDAPKMAAMKKFQEGHWEKDVNDVDVAGGSYSEAGEFNQCSDYKREVDALANYAKSHKAKH